MGLGRKVNDRVEGVLGEQIRENSGIADIPADGDVPGVVLEISEIPGIRGVGHFVEIHNKLDPHPDFIFRGGEEHAHKIGANKTETAGDKDAHGKGK